MPNESQSLDRVFRALAHPTRRDVISRLGRGEAAMTELSQRHQMALPSFLQHLEVLEESGLISSQKSGRVRTYRLELNSLLEAESWLDLQRMTWQCRLNQLDTFLESSKESQT